MPSWPVLFASVSAMKSSQFSNGNQVVQNVTTTSVRSVNANSFFGLLSLIEEANLPNIFFDVYEKATHSISLLCKDC